MLPVGAALAMGERAGAAVYTGAALCLVAIVLDKAEKNRAEITSGGLAARSFGKLLKKNGRSNYTVPDKTC